MEEREKEKYEDELEALESLEDYYMFLMEKIDEKDFVIAQLIACCKEFSEQITELYENMNLLNDVNGVSEFTTPEELEGIKIDYDAERKKLKEAGYFT